MSEFLDELARSMAKPMPRRRALRMLGGALAGAALPGAWASRALAGVKGQQFHLCNPDPRCFLCECPAPPAGDGTALFYKICCPKNGPTLGDNCVCYKPPNGGAACKPKKRCDATCGKECCKEGECCCDRIFTLKDPYCCDCKEADKQACQDFEVAFTGVAIFAGAAASLATAGLAAALIGATAGAGVVALASKICADDPPDPRYKELFRPHVPRVTSVRPGTGISPAAARALDRMIANRIRAGAYTLAWIRSIEKAQGAKKGGDEAWARRHRTAAAGYARVAASTLERDKSLSTVALRELQAGGFVDAGVSIAQTRQWQQRVRLQGLPAEMTRVLRAAGADDARIAAYRTAVSRLDPKLVAGVGVFGSLTDPRIAAAYVKMTDALRRSARTLS